MGYKDLDPDTLGRGGTSLLTQPESSPRPGSPLPSPSPNVPSQGYRDGPRFRINLQSPHTQQPSPPLLPPEVPGSKTNRKCFWGLSSGDRGTLLGRQSRDPTGGGGHGVGNVDGRRTTPPTVGSPRPLSIRSDGKGPVEPRWGGSGRKVHGGGESTELSFGVLNKYGSSSETGPTSS